MHMSADWLKNQARKTESHDHVPIFNWTCWIQSIKPTRIEKLPWLTTLRNKLKSPSLAPQT
jgi:hypothetical protein